MYISDPRTRQAFLGHEHVSAVWKLYDVMQIANAVPTSTQLTEWLRRGGAPVTGREIGLGDEEIQLGLDYGNFLRKRFTINKLRHWLELP